MDFKQKAIHSVAELIQISNAVESYFNLIYIKTNKYANILDRLKTCNFDIIGDLPIIRLHEIIKIQDFSKVGIHIEKLNYNDGYTYLYLPLCLTEEMLDELIVRIQKVISNV